MLCAYGSICLSFNNVHSKKVFLYVLMARHDHKDGFAATAVTLYSVRDELDRDAKYMFSNTIYDVDC